MTHSPEESRGVNRPHSLLSESDRQALSAAMERARQRERESFLLVLEATAEQHPQPPVTRLRQLLKIALRGLGLQCLEARRTDGSAVGE